MPLLSRSPTAAAATKSGTGFPAREIRYELRFCFHGLESPCHSKIVVILIDPDRYQHNVHHIDPALGVSTGFRFHFGEVLVSAVFRVVQTSAIGMSFATFAANAVVFQANTLFTTAICGCRFVSSDG